MANRSKNIFAYLDSDDEDVPKTAPKKTETPAPGAPVALNKGPNAGNKKTSKKVTVVEGEKKEIRAPREGAPREGGRGAARGGRGGARGGRGGARDFERRSGTGRGKETSKQGGGARNWGNDTDKSELVAEAEVQEGKVEGEETEAVEEAPVEEDEEEVQLTLDEYLAKKKESRVGELFAEKEVRQVTDDFSAAVVITKDGKTPDFIEAKFEKVFTKKTSGRKKQLITDLGFQAAAPERRPFREEREGGRGGRGDREGGRGRGDRDGGRGGRGGDRGRGAPRGRGAARGGRSSAAPNVADLSAFPSL